MWEVNAASRHVHVCHSFDMCTLGAPTMQGGKADVLLGESPSIIFVRHSCRGVWKMCYVGDMAKDQQHSCMKQTRRARAKRRGGWRTACIPCCGTSYEHDKSWVPTHKAENSYEQTRFPHPHVRTQQICTGCRWAWRRKYQPFRMLCTPHQGGP